jgi:2,4-dienoyl-CoA reductase-like NADH-dependent reductase (Old Yellow Enzyme family)
MTAEEIKEIADNFAAAAKRAVAAGYDGVGTRGARHYLPSKFPTPHDNHRTDQYGGALENRARFLRGTVRAVRGAVGGGFPVRVKINVEDFMADPPTFEDSIKVCRKLAEPGVDAVEVPAGWFNVQSDPDADMAEIYEEFHKKGP